MFGKDKKQVKRVFVSCCSKNKPEWNMALSLQDAMSYAAKHGITTTFKPRIGESLICRARQNDIPEFMQRNFDYLFSVDDDVVLPQNTIQRLVAHDKDIVAGVYRLKEDEPHTAVRIPKNGPKWPEILREGLLTPAIYVSTGCMLIKRVVIERMIKEYPELEYRRNMHGDRCWAFYMPFVYRDEYLSEDWAFCQRACDTGFEVWVDGAIRCGHWGKKLYRFPDPEKDKS
ncbi:MAG: hypothetical protein KAT58_07205 [candidate division Zixibacteria bacterium]|nr:hypothetical protein [candidate division Zixibacteria bacterium]